MLTGLTLGVPLLALAALHTPYARARVLAFAVERLREDYGIVATVGALDYDLVALRLTLGPTTLTAAGADTPFLRFERAAVDVPWSIVGGALGVQSLEIDRPSVTIRNQAGARTNLPVGADAPAQPPPPSTPFGAVRIGALAIRHLEVRYVDVPSDTAIDARDLSLVLVPEGGEARGRLWMEGAATISMAGRSTAITHLGSGVAFDGERLALDDFVIALPEGRLRVAGEVEPLALEPRVTARFDGRADVAPLVAWVADAADVSGTVVLSGAVEGPIAAPAIEVDARADDLAWRDRRDVTLSLGVRLTPSTATLDRLLVGVDGGRLEVSATVGLDDETPSRASVMWTRLDLGRLARTASPTAPRLDALADGRLTATWRGSSLDAATAAVEASLAPGRRPGAGPAVDAHLSAALNGGRWTATVDRLAVGSARVSGSVSGQASSDDVIESTLAGSLHGVVSDLPSLMATLAAAGVASPASPLADGRATLDLRLGGSIAAPTARATLAVSDLVVTGVGPGTLTVVAALDSRRVTVDTADLAIGDNHLRATLDVDLASGRLAGVVGADLRDFGALAAQVAPDLRPGGTATLEAVIGGSLDDPRGEVTGQAAGLTAVGQRIDDVQFSARLSGGVVDLQRLDLTQGVGRLRASGAYRLASGGYRFAVDGRALTVHPLTTGDAPVPLSASFDIEARGEGQAEAPAATATLVARDVAWGTYRIGAARMEATVADDRVDVLGGVPALALRFAGGAALAAPRAFNAEVRADGAQLDAMSRPDGPAAPGGDDRSAVPLTGSVTAVMTAAGHLDDPAAATVDLDLRLADVRAADTPLVLADLARLHYEDGRLSIDRVELRLGTTTLTAEGAFGAPTGGEALTVALQGQAADALPFVRLVPGYETLDAGGAVDIRVTAAGTVDAPDVDATVDARDLRISLPDVPPVTDGTVRASFAEGMLTLSTLAAAWQGASLSAEGRAPVTLLGDRLPASYLRALPDLPREATATLQLRSLSTRLAAPFVDPETLEQVEVDVAARVELAATSLALEAIDASVVLDRAAFVVAGQSLAQATPTTVRLRDGRVTVDAWEWRGDQNVLRVSGGAMLSGETPDVDAAVTGTLDLRMLGAASPDLRAGGRARLDVRARGPLAAPAFDGEIVFDDGDVALRDPRVALTGLAGRIALARDRVRVVDLRAAANGGALLAQGEIELDGLEPAGGTITIEGRGLALEAPEHLRSELDLDLALALAADDPRLTGRVLIRRGAYREPVSLANQLLTGVQVDAAIPAEPGLLDRLRLDVDVVSDEGIVVDNNYGRLDIGADLKVIGTAAVPSLAGRLAIAEGGAVFLAGQTWAVERGTVDFTNATTIEPTLDLSFTTRVQQYDVRLSVTGTPATLEATLSSPDGISEADAISLLLTGALADEQTIAQRDIARGQLVLLLSGELLGFAGRAVGLDSAQVGRGLGGAGSSFDLLATDSDPATRLTLTKQLRRDVEIVFSRSLQNTNDITWIAIYRPLRALELRTTTLDDNARSYEFRHELTFGGPPSRVRAASRAPTRVAGVTITGVAAAETDDLHRRLRLTGGDRFDYYRWQQDRDRLVAFYHERGRLEAEVRATREPAVESDGEAVVRLSYAVDPGPATIVVVDGPALPGGLLDEIRENWTHAVFDGFLEDDSAAMVRQAFAADGHLQAQVDAEVEVTADGRKTLRLLVDPGPRFTDRRLIFDGQRAVSADALAGVLDGRGLRTAAWLRPREAETALVAHYRALGYAKAHVTVGAPTFTGTEARLPIAIDEGREFRIGMVDIRGVAARPIDDVRKTFRITAGDVYRPAALDAARREVEIAYAAAGFNDMRATVTGRIDDDAAQVAVSLEVDEGAQQIVTDVIVRGRRLTTPGTVAAAADLERGAPADRADTYRAQKRLYDTGVFRRADVDFEPVGPVTDAGVQPVQAAVTLEEVAPYRLRYGLRLTDDTGPLEADRTLRLGAVVDGLRRNLFGRAFSAGLAGQIEADRRLARAIVSAPRLFGLPVTSNLFLTRSRQDLNADGAIPLVRDGAEIVAEQRFSPRADMTVAYNYRFLRTHVFPVAAEADDPFDLRIDVARLTGNVARDTRDDPFDPGRGSFVSTGIEFATPTLGSDIRFMKFVYQHSRFMPVGPVVLASALRFGTAWAFDEPLLFSERYFAGGGTSVRGFAEGALGGVDFLGDPAGGANSLVLNQEVRFPIYKWARGVGFLDAGNLYDRIRDVSLRDLEYGAGLGLRLETPFGLARVDFAVPLSDRRRQPLGRWYFSIGQAF